jgi:hypothetical protein
MVTTSVTGWVGLTLLAGSNWTNATNSGSQSRNANNSYHWNINSNISSRTCTDPGKCGEQLLAGLANLVLEQAKHTTEEMGS